MAISFLFKNAKGMIYLFLLFSCRWDFAEPNLNKFAKQAEKLFLERLYDDAAQLYSQALSHAGEDEIREQLAQRLAICHIKEGKAQEALLQLSPLSTFKKNHSLYLMSLALRKLGKKQEALSLLDLCKETQESSQGKTMITLERGYHLFHLGDRLTARHIFSSIDRDEKGPLPYGLAQLHLAKIQLMDRQLEEAFQTLDDLSGYFPTSHPLNLERIYLTGLVLSAKQQDVQAALCFEELYPQAVNSNGEWALEVLQGLIISLLKQALASDLPNDRITLILLRAEEALRELITRAPIENSYLLLTDLYLIKAKTLGDPQAYVLAQQLLEKPNISFSNDELRQAQLKIAEAAPTYLERNQLILSLSTDPRNPPLFCATALLLKGTNDFNEGLKFQALNHGQADQYFAQAAQACDEAAKLASASDARLSSLALKKEALALIHMRDHPHIRQAWGILLRLVGNQTRLSAFDSPQEIYYLAGWTALHFKEPELLKQGRIFLMNGQNGSSAAWTEKCLKLEGLICLQLGAWKEADALFFRLLSDFPASPARGEAWFWRAYCATELQNNPLKQEYLQNAYVQNACGPYAPIAYFYVHNLREYMHGSRKAIKHLQAMPRLFPAHPLLICAHYLIGLHQKKDLLSVEGQIVKRKDLTAAIEAFQAAESTFDALFNKNGIAPRELAYYLHMRTRAQLERAQANFAIAKSSAGGKKQIYLEYAERVFNSMIQEFMSVDSLVNQQLITASSPYPKTWAEAELTLAQVYQEKDWLDQADAVLSQSLKRYQEAKVTHSYGLMTLWLEKGRLAQKQQDAKGALESFIEAEKAAGDFTTLSPNEKLDLWIQQSLCYKSLHELDLSMQLLSRVINDDVISPLRIKAMYLRAEVYAMQGRPELAIKQLEATARKGGEWAKKAQEKLETTYGYQYVPDTDR